MGGSVREDAQRVLDQRLQRHAGLMHAGCVGLGDIRHVNTGQSGRLLAGGRTEILLHQPSLDTKVVQDPLEASDGGDLFIGEGGCC